MRYHPFGLTISFLASNEYKINNSELNLLQIPRVTLVKVQAKDKAGNLSDIETVNFEIKVPNVKLSSISLLPLGSSLLGLSLGFGVIS